MTLFNVDRRCLLENYYFTIDLMFNTLCAVTITSGYVNLILDVETHADRIAYSLFKRDL